MRPLRPGAVLLPLLPQPQLPEVSPRSDRTVDHPTTRTLAAVPVLSANVHPSRRSTPTGPATPQNCLRSAHESCRRGPPEAGRGSSISRRAFGDAGRTAHLDPRHALPPSRPHACHRRRPFSRWQPLGSAEESEVPGSCQGTLKDFRRKNVRRCEKSRATSARPCRCLEQALGCPLPACRLRRKGFGVFGTVCFPDRHHQ